MSIILHGEEIFNPLISNTKFPKIISGNESCLFQDNCLSLPYLYETIYEKNYRQYIIGVNVCDGSCDICTGKQTSCGAAGRGEHC